MNERNSSEIIDEFILEQTGPRAWRMGKELLRMVFVFGRLDVAKFAKDAGVTENEVRQYFGGEPASEPEEADDHDDGDETEAATPDATQILSQQINLLERDSNNILDTADRDYNDHGGDDADRLLDQLNALNHQLNILTRMFAIHARNTLKGSEDR